MIGSTFLLALPGGSRRRAWRLYGPGHASPPVVGGHHGLLTRGRESASVEPGLHFVRVVRGAGSGSLPHAVVGGAVPSVAPVPQCLWPPAQEGRRLSVGPVALSFSHGHSFLGGSENPTYPNSLS